MSPSSLFVILNLFTTLAVAQLVKKEDIEQNRLWCSSTPAISQRKVDYFKNETKVEYDPCYNNITFCLGHGLVKDHNVTSVSLHAVQNGTESIIAELSIGQKIHSSSGIDCTLFNSSNSKDVCSSCSLGRLGPKPKFLLEIKNLDNGHMTSVYLRCWPNGQGCNKNLTTPNPTEEMATSTEGTTATSSASGIMPKTSVITVIYLSITTYVLITLV